MRREEFTLHAVAGGLPRGSFRPVFTELRVGPLVGFGIGPRTPGAVKTLDLIQRDQSPRSSPEAHFTHGGL
jgi:hypothetical protein